MYKVFFTKKAEKHLAKLARVDAKRIIEKLQGLTYPFSPNYDIDKMGGFENVYRLRVGKTRTFFELDIDEREIWIRKCKYRGGAYKN